MPRPAATASSAGPTYAKASLLRQGVAQSHRVSATAGAVRQRARTHSETTVPSSVVMTPTSADMTASKASSRSAGGAVPRRPAAPSARSVATELTSTSRCASMAAGVASTPTSASVTSLPYQSKHLASSSRLISGFPPS